MEKNIVTQQNKPIGIFDSGIGGLSIAHAIKDELPNEDLMYFADLAFSPYGDKSQQVIKERSEFILRFLVKQGCKAIVVACNTATVNTISHLREKFSIPIIGVEPGIKPAALLSKTGVIGVLATERTILSESFHILKENHANTVKIESIACPKFVSLVESCEHESEGAMRAAEQYIRPLLSKKCDQIILGCTHFSFLRPIINNVVKTEANIIDTALPVAIEVKRRLQSLNLLNNNDNVGKTQLWTNRKSSKLTESIKQLWQHHIDISELTAN